MLQSLRILVSFLCIVVLSCSYSLAETNQSPTLRYFLMIPSDQANKHEDFQKINESIRIVQEWFAKQLNGKTFKIASEGLQILIIPEHSSYFAKPTSYDAAVCYDVAQRYTQAKVNDPHHLWLVFVKNAEFISHGNNGFACLSTDPFFSVRHRKDINPETAFQSIIAHELGHALGLKHPISESGKDRASKDDVDKSIMSRWGGILFPDRTYISEHDKNLLKSSKFIY